jgi:hypothetical protein
MDCAPNEVLNDAADCYREICYSEYYDEEICIVYNLNETMIYGVQIVESMCSAEWYAGQGIDFGMAAMIAQAYNHTLSDAFHELCAGGECIVNATTQVIAENNLGDMIDGFLNNPELVRFANNTLDDTEALTGVSVDVAKEVLNADSA